MRTISSKRLSGGKRWLLVLLACILVLGTVIIYDGFAVLPKEELSEELKLSDYPEHFKENTVIVVGDNASQIEKNR